jgi:tetratricopeptide (TPR) repeat protein
MLLQSSVFGQFNKYCNYTQVAVEKYGEKNVELARQYIDSALLMCPDLAKDAYSYHVKGFIYYELFKTKEIDDLNSKYREVALTAFVKSNALDDKGEFKKNNLVSIRNIGKYYQKNCVDLLKVRKVDEALAFNVKFKEVMSLAGANDDLTKWDVSLNNSIGDIYWDMYQENMQINEAYFEKAIEQFNKVISIDSLDHHSVYTIGVMYYNRGFQYILDLSDDADLLEVLDAQEKQVEYGLKSLPYLKRAYALKPKNKETINGLSAIYYMLQEKEKHQFYQNLLNQLVDEPDEE